MSEEPVETNAPAAAADAAIEESTRYGWPLGPEAVPSRELSASDLASRP